MTKIVTMIRLKPLLNSSDKSYKIDINKKEELTVYEKKKLYDLSEVNKQHIFTYDKIYTENNTTDDIFNNIGIEIVDNILKKINTTLFVFGQTGSGKTHTIMGSNEKYGFVNILINYLSDMGKKFNVSAIEIYNDVCYDILNLHNVIHQREDYDGNIILAGITNKKILNKNDISHFFNSIKNNRRVGISSQNDKSSRSHLQIKIEMENKSFIKVLDLAGSERASQSNFINRDVYKENVEINKSLLALKECIRAHKLKNSHIPIRSSKLTKLLKDSFNGICNTYVLGTIAQEERNFVDSMNTLNYMSDIKYIKKIDRTKLPEIKTKINYDNIVKPVKPEKKYVLPSIYNSHVLSPNYRLIVRNKYILDNNINNQNEIIKKICKSRSSKKLKSEFLNVLDGQEQFIKKIKNHLI